MEIKKNKMLTGCKNTDYEVLYNLNDYDLGNIFKVNKYINDLSKDENFWMNRFYKKFLPIFETIDEMSKNKKERNFQTWRDYYIDLFKFIEIYYQDECGNEYFKAKKNIDYYRRVVKFIDIKTLKYRECWKTNFNFLKEDFIDLNHLFKIIIEIRDENNRDKRVKLFILSKFFATLHFRINFDATRKFLNFYGEEAIDLLLKDKNKKTRENSIGSIIFEYIFLFDKIIPRIKNSSEILDVLFKKLIRGGYELENEMIKKVLNEAMKKGASKKDIKIYYILNKGENKWNKDENYFSYINYNNNMKLVKNFLKSLKTDKIKIIRDILKNNRFSEEKYDEILKILRF